MRRSGQHKMSITNKILIGMAFGLVLGSLLNVFASDNELVQIYLVQGLFHAVGKMFVNALKMLVVPLVVFSLICGVCGIGDVGILGRVGLRAFLLYLITTVMAISLALVVAILVAPGKNGEHLLMQSGQFEAKEAPPLTDVFINIIPDNPVHALASGEMLQIIFFVILFAIAMLMSGDAGERLAEVAEQLNEVMMGVVTLVMDFAPIGVFFLMAKTFAEQGIGLILPMVGYFSVVIACLILHAFGTLNILLFMLSRLSPLGFMSKMRSERSIYCCL